ncbi:MAG: GIY-YIG nuclease family protein [Candidatus Omnitrophica bacterium]|nr:GIY-YIG nuclease family protein [Candidatus Omnitrophota bacterium]MBU2044664.1 GIY-YIG nuclease family protein [Candidatus Omnitrophota bacterium]MBU2266088.1 GIY-YIG nuclease family protein [Candidatus Omnitrophota bacterium]
MDKRWYLYIIKCKDQKLYTGITNNLDNRIKQHNRGQGCRFTKFRRPVELKYSEEFLSKSEVLKREAEIKGWSKDKKIQLINRGTSALQPRCHQKIRNNPK